MNRLRVLVAVVALSIAAPALTAADPAGELKIVFIAYENPNQLMEDVRPVVAYLEKALSRPIRAFAATDYAGVVEALAEIPETGTFTAGEPEVLG